MLTHLRLLAHTFCEPRKLARYLDKSRLAEITACNRILLRNIPRWIEDDIYASLPDIEASKRVAASRSGYGQGGM